MTEIQVKFVSADEKFKILDSINIISLPTDSTEKMLNTLVNDVLLENGNCEDIQQNRKQTNFSYLIQGQLFQSETVASHLLLYQLSTENVLEILFFVQVEAPKPKMQYPHDDWVSSVDISQNYILTSTYNGTISLWHLNSKNPENSLKKFPTQDHTFSAHAQAIKSVKFLKNQENPNNNKLNSFQNSFISCSSDQTAIIWKFETKNTKKDDALKPEKSLKITPLFKLKGHTESIEAAAVSTSNIATVSADRTIKIWENFSSENQIIQENQNHEPPAPKKGPHTKGQPKTPILTISGHNETITDVIFDKSTKISDKIYTASLDHTVKLWDIEIAKELDKVNSAKAILKIGMNSENDVLATASTDRHIRIYDKKNLSNNVKSSLSFHRGWVSSLCFNPINKFQLLSTSFDKSAVLWDIRSNKTPIYEINAHTDRVLCSHWGFQNLIATGGVDCNLATFDAGQV